MNAFPNSMAWAIYREPGTGAITPVPLPMSRPPWQAAGHRPAEKEWTTRLRKLRRRTGGVIDRRNEAPAGGLGRVPGLGSPSGGSGLPIPGGAGGLGIGAILVILVLVFVLPRLLGGGGLIPDPGAVQGFPNAGSGGSTTEVDPTDPTGEFVDAVGDDIQIMWQELFAGAGRRYDPTQIVLFRGSTDTGCGLGSSDTGPFYCPADRRVYLDHSFFGELERRFGASGDFAEAYVIAHEIGHHVQTLLGISEQVQQSSRDDPSNANELSIRQELQADCFAGVWGSSANARGVLEPGDLEEGIGAAAAVGDDRIQASTSGRIDPESWTHGSAEQRVRWFRTGFRAGNPEACDTFSVSANDL
ncbi:MAG TPA: neutral zinc metallopeptidase [Actinomycetota bacterium]|nr:neutral zinc metallopeptidase [Actinomycetota bacterium]